MRHDDRAWQHELRLRTHAYRAWRVRGGGMLSSRSRRVWLASTLLSVALIVMSMPAAAGALDREKVIDLIAATNPGQVPDLTRKHLAGLDLSQLDFRGADLFAVDLSGAKLRGANLSGANLNRAVLREADLAGANLRAANMFAVIMTGADLTGADLSQARIIGELQNTRLNGAKLIKADLGFDPTNQNMVPAIVDLSGAMLDEANLTHANLTSASMQYASLKGAQLTHARLNWAKLAGANLSGADLSGADLSDADLTNAILRDVKGADSATGLGVDPAR